MRVSVSLLIAHAVLLALASTNFSVVSWLWGDPFWSWSYFQYRYAHGWGGVYVSDYTLVQVLCYIGAYGLGSAAFGLALLRRRLRFTAVATVLCVLGVVSFCIEATHGVWSHQFTWIASFPAVMVVLWICVVVQLGGPSPASGQSAPCCR